MTDTLTTPIKIAFIHPNGDRQPLGIGEISAQGEIVVTEPAAGQEEYLDDLVTELNNRSFIVIKGPPPEGADRFSIGKRKVERDSVEFILEFAAYAERAYALELDFDVNVLAPAADDTQRLAEPAPQTEARPETDGPAAQTDDPNESDPDAVQLSPIDDETPVAIRPPSPDTPEGETKPKE